MTVDERTRFELHKLFAATFGDEYGAAVMELLPPVGWGDVATKRDLDALAIATKRDFEAHAIATKRDFEAHAIATKRDIDALGASTKRDLEHAVQVLRSEFKGDLQQGLHDVTVRLGSLMVATTLSGVGLAFTAAKLG